MPRALEVLDQAVRQLERGEASALEVIDTLFAEELTLRENRRVKMALRMAKLSTVKTLAGFDFSFQPSLDRNRILALAQLGTGKSHLATALGVEAVKAGRSVYFASLADIITQPAAYLGAASQRCSAVPPCPNYKNVAQPAEDSAIN
jgi:DNA replication protein DnaC